MKQVNIGFRDDQLAFAQKHDLKLPQLIRKLFDRYIDKREAEEKKVANYNSLSK